MGRFFNRQDSGRDAASMIPYLALLDKIFAAWKT
jgi:hypothetical protein